MNSPFFSVILPTYNRANMIGKAIDSVLKQHYPNWELLVVDDGSTDNTKQVVEAYNDARIRYIYQQNAERSAARNNGIANAKGQYVCFIDSDDYYFDNHLSAFQNYIQENNVGDAFLYALTAVDLDGQIIKVPHQPVQTSNNIEFFILNVVGIPRACIARNILNKHKFNPAVSIGEDTELWVRIAREYPIHFVNEYTQAYTEHTGRSVSLTSLKPFIAHRDNLKSIFANFSLAEISTAVRKEALSYAYFRIARYYIYTGNKGAAIKNILQSITANPGDERLKYRVNLLIKCLVSTKKAEQILE